VPLRTCVVCRSKEPKRGFIRIVRAPDGSLAIDPTGKANGRGAYLCAEDACWQRAADGSFLDRALKTEVPAPFRATLRRYADEHFRPADDSETQHQHLTQD
jgi:predicted RNA-binding protein YlxR (DUF448 family)